MSSPQERELQCATGTVTAKIGDRFKGDETEWEIVAFATTTTYSPSTLGGTPNVYCRPDKMPIWYGKYAEKDGTVIWCGDSVAAHLLTENDGKPRDSNGHLLRRPKTTPA